MLNGGDGIGFSNGVVGLSSCQPFGLNADKKWAKSRKGGMI